MTRSELEELQWRKLGPGLALAFEHSSFYRRKFTEHDIAPASLQSVHDLHRLPFTTKDELIADQAQSPPYGSNLTQPMSAYVRIHQTSGTSGRRLRWLDTRASWQWLIDCWQEIFDAANITPADRFFLPFSFGPFLGFWAAFEGAIERGCFTMAGGAMTSKARIEAIIEHQSTVVATTPTYALELARIADAHSLNLAGAPVRRVILAGEPGGQIPAVRERIEKSWDARVIDHSGMTEVGSATTEFTDFPGKLFVLETQFIAEFLDPESLEPVAEGSLGELVLTNLGRWANPLIRYRTGDIVRWRQDVAPPGHPYRYLDGGILGRTDDMLWIKGNNLYPSSIEAVLRRHDEVGEFLIDVDDRREPHAITLLIEPISAAVAGPDLVAKLSRSFQDQLYVRPEIRLVATGDLPRHEFKARRIRRRSTDG